MRRKYRDCVRIDGNCTLCQQAESGKDCHGRPITKLEWARLGAGMSQLELSEKSNVSVRYIQRIELGEGEAGNMSARNLLALADALGVDPRELI